jgi:hypothetical protein
VKDDERIHFPIVDLSLDKDRSSVLLLHNLYSRLLVLSPSAVRWSFSISVSKKKKKRMEERKRKKGGGKSSKLYNFLLTRRTPTAHS